MIFEATIRLIGNRRTTFQLRHNVTAVPGPEHTVGRIECARLRAAEVSVAVYTNHKADRTIITFRAFQLYRSGFRTGGVDQVMIGAERSNTAGRKINKLDLVY